jgi:hypothetical protein
VARILFKQGIVFMLDIFNKRETIAHATNRLFEVGFYLLNIGFALVILRIYANAESFTMQRMIETLSAKLGGFSIYLGATLFLILFLLVMGKRYASQRRMAIANANLDQRV